MKKILILLLIVPFFFACKDDASSSSEPESKPKPVIQAMCGDGKVDENEVCDDGNLNDNDGCSRNCLREYAQVGQACSDTFLCDVGLVCSTSGKCERPKSPNGAACTSDDDCASRRCEISEGSIGMCSSN